MSERLYLSENSVINKQKMKRILFLFCLVFSINSFGQHAEETAIKQLLEKESQTWRSGDTRGHADCWAIRPYSKIIVSGADGKILDIPPQLMIDPPAEMVGKGGYSVNSNYNISISGNRAWVSHNEESVSKDGTKSYTYEFRMLEKIKGDWKLVAQSIHAYKP